MANTIVSNVGNHPNETGLATQAHVIYAANSGRWWAFWLNSTTSIASAYSSDGVSWTAGASLTTTTSGDGRDMDVFYANLGSVDVVHVVKDNGGTDDHVRGTISGTTLTWGSVVSHGSNNTTVYGENTAVDSAGHVWDTTPQNGDYSVQVATNTDSGGSWTNAWGTGEVAIISATIVNNTFNRALIPYAAGGKLLAVAGNGGTSTTDTQLNYAYYNGSTWGSDASYGGSSTGTDFNDWGIARLSDTDIHVVRRIGTNSYEHRRWNGSSTWSAGNTIPTQTSKGAAGMALASDGTNVWLFIIDSAAGNNVLYSKWTSGTGWSSFTTLESTSATRNNIGVCPQENGTKWLVYWTDGSTSPYAIKGAILDTSGGAINATAAISGSGSIGATPYALCAATILGVGSLGLNNTAANTASLQGAGSLGATANALCASSLLGTGSIGSSSQSLNTAGLIGSGSIGATSSALCSAGLSGAGAIGAVGTAAGQADLIGTGSISGTSRALCSAGLGGAGSILGDIGGTLMGLAALAGSGSLQATSYALSLLALLGSGSLGAHPIAPNSAGLMGAGQVLGAPVAPNTAALAGSGAMAAASRALLAAALTGSGSILGSPVGTYYKLMATVAFQSGISASVILQTAMDGVVVLLSAGNISGTVTFE